MLKHFQHYSRDVGLTLVALLAVGCGGGGEAGDGAAAGGETMVSVVDAATAGTVSGRVTFEGMAPEAVLLDMSEEEVCADKYTDPPTSETVVVNEDGSLANVFVYVKDGLGDMTFPTPSEPVVLDQDGCRYHPHVFGLQPGQDLVIRNSDALQHNINAKPQANRGFNISQPVVMETTKQFRVSEVMIRFECDVHSWMLAFGGVLDHPYHSVTGEVGSFSLSPLPPGTYVIEAWHELYGTQSQEVTVGESEEVEITFTFGEAAA